MSSTADNCNGASLQVPREVIMIRPRHFGFDPQTAATNSFQEQFVGGGADVSADARDEFDGAVVALRRHDVKAGFIFAITDVTCDYQVMNAWLFTL